MQRTWTRLWVVFLDGAVASVQRTRRQADEFAQLVSTDLATYRVVGPFVLAVKSKKGSRK